MKDEHKVAIYVIASVAALCAVQAVLNLVSPVSARNWLVDRVPAYAVLVLLLTVFFKLLHRRKQHREALRTEKNQAQTYLDVAGVILLAISSDETIRLINKKGCEILGCKEKEAIGKNWFDTFLPENRRKDIRKIFGRLMAGDIAPVEYVE